MNCILYVCLERVHGAAFGVARRSRGHVRSAAGERSRCELAGKERTHSTPSQCTGGCRASRYHPRAERSPDRPQDQGTGSRSETTCSVMVVSVQVADVCFNLQTERVLTSYDSNS